MNIFAVIDLASPDLSESYDDFGGFEHILDADPFVSRMVILFTSEDVWRRESVERELRPVGAAANGHLPNFETRFFDGFHGICRDVGVLVENGAHVAVLDFVFAFEC